MPLVSPPLQSSTRTHLNGAAPSWDPFGFRPVAPQDRGLDSTAAPGASLSPTAPTPGISLLAARRETMPHLSLGAHPPSNFHAGVPGHFDEVDPLRSPPGVVPSSRASSGNNVGQRPPAVLVSYNFPGDLTPREAHLLFAFAPEYISCDVTRPTKEEAAFCVPDSTVVTARFHSVQAAQAAQMMLDNRVDLFADYPSSTSSPRGSQDSNSAAPTPPIRCEVRGPSSGQNSGGLGKSRFQFGEDETCSIAASRAGSVSAVVPQFGPAMPASAGSAKSPFAGGSMSVADRIFSPAGSRPLPQGRTLFGDHVNNSMSGLHISGMSSQQSAESHTMDRRPSAPSLSVSSPPSINGVLPSMAKRPSVTGRTFVAPNSAGGSDDPSKVVIPYTPQTQAKAAAVLQNGGRVLPPANPADQNPPCNTLYVGNLPPDTQEEELKELFSTRAGYRRLCFRAKSNGPMCFVEFEDEHYAGRALEELYGFGLSNSIKGGIRLSYSKNPLGVRSNRPRTTGSNNSH